MAKKSGDKVATAKYLPPYTLPVREWDRGTEIIRMFAMTGHIANARPQSVLLISEPGSGKSELVDRFKDNASLKYASDITSRGLYPVLTHALHRSRSSKEGIYTHLVASEFQKFLLRKSHTAMATLGLLCQAMEEGVEETRIGDQVVDFGGARLGIIGAITHDTAAKWQRGFVELGFWSRCAAFEWEVPLAEMKVIMRKITDGDKSDLTRVALKTPPKPVTVAFPTALSEQFEDFVIQRYREHAVLRVFNRFRTLAMACALLDGRDSVRAFDVEKVVAFTPYWERMNR